MEASFESKYKAFWTGGIINLGTLDAPVAPDMIIHAKFDFNGDGVYTKRELALALDLDRVVIKKRVVRELKSNQNPQDPDGKIRMQMNDIALQALTSDWKYRENRSRSDGSTYIRWHAEAQLQDLSKVLEKIKELSEKLSQKNPQYDEVYMESRYALAYADSNRCAYEALTSAIKQVHDLTK
jgi:hypothetical protein